MGVDLRVPLPERFPRHGDRGKRHPAGDREGGSEPAKQAELEILALVSERMGRVFFEPRYPFQGVAQGVAHLSAQRGPERRAASVGTSTRQHVLEIVQRGQMKLSGAPGLAGAQGVLR